LVCRQDDRFSVAHLFNLLAWLHSAMQAAQHELHQLRSSDNSAVPMLPAPLPANGSAPSSAAPSSISDRERVLQIRDLQQHLYHCSALAERSVAAVAGCLKAVEAEVEQAKGEGKVSDADRSMVQEVLQCTAALMVRTFNSKHSRMSATGRLINLRPPCKSARMQQMYC
jgi:hypothetical protein